MVITPIVNDGRINRSKTTLNKIVAATISLLRKNNNGQIPTAHGRLVFDRCYFFLIKK